MFCFTASINREEAENNLEKLLHTYIDPVFSQKALQKLESLSIPFINYAAPPWFTADLLVDHETDYQSELWLPFKEIRPIFENFYRQALCYQPTLNASPFATASSWADLLAKFPTFFPVCSTPKRLLEHLLIDKELRKKFLFWSFMPKRFYAAVKERYPLQSQFISEWLQQKEVAVTNSFRCLDAASGDGFKTYLLAKNIYDRFTENLSFEIEGWTLEPLEVWAAAHCCFPDDSYKETLFRKNVAAVFANNINKQISFSSVDLLKPPSSKPFDLIICNGLLGGPIINSKTDIGQIITNLVILLKPGGILLTANNFHAGWQQKCPQSLLRTIFEESGLLLVEDGEGVAGIKR